MPKMIRNAEGSVVVKQWWRRTADDHAKRDPKDGPFHGDYSPSLVTGRCRCAACRAGRAEGYVPKLKTNNP